MLNLWRSKKDILFGFLKEKGFTLLLLSVAFTISSLLWTRDIAYNQNDFRNIEFGWPIAFVTQNYSQIEPPASWFPYKTSFGLPQEYPTSFRFLPFFLAVFFNFIIIFSAVLIAANSHPKLRFVSKLVRIKYIVVGIIGVLVFIPVSAMIFNIYYQYRLRMSEKDLMRRFNNGDFSMPASTIFPWQDALGILYSGQVIKVSQSHNLDVIFILKNGRVIQTKEPYIDEIFKEIKKCGKICNRNIISIATE